MKGTGIRRWFRFSLRTLMLAMTLCCFGVFAKLQYDWHCKKAAARSLIEPLLQRDVLPASGDGIPYNRLSAPVTLPAKTPKEAVELIEFFINDLDRPEERVAGVKVLVEQYPKLARDVLLRIGVNSRYPEIRAVSAQIISLLRDTRDIDMFVRLLDDPEEKVRAAAADAVGIVHKPAYEISGVGLLGSDLGGSPCVASNPPIRIEDLVSLSNTKQTVSEQNQYSNQLRDGSQKVMPSVRQRLEAMMLEGKTLSEREAAARALVEWPPEEYLLRCAEWGVWIDDGGELKLAQSVINEIPPFVHRTGNDVDSFANRVNQIIFVTKPIIHVTASQPLAIDLEAMIARGRPWFVYPMPNDFTLRVGLASRVWWEEQWQNAQDDREKEQLGRWKPPPALSGFDNPRLPRLEIIAEGYPWIRPSHRSWGPTSSNGLREGPEIISMGLRWQSLIVSPEKKAWMQEPKNDSDPRFAWWDALRRVPSSWLSNRGESERFLYYDGPTNLPSPVRLSLGPSSLVFHWPPPHNFGINDLGDNTNRLFTNSFVWKAVFISVQENAAEALLVTTTSSVEWANSGGPKLFNHLPTATVELPSNSGQGDEQPREILHKLLVEAGLTADEANGLCDAWNHQFFETPGQRCLTLMPRVYYDHLCPLKIRPQPTELVRVGLVLTEFDSAAD